MSDGERPLSTSIDVNVASVARMCDYYLGGKDHYPADRRACERLNERLPGTRALIVNNRRFLRRTVRILAADFGVRQFIDHGTGLPTHDNVHQVAQRVAPDSHVVYVGNDPLVLAHGRALLEEETSTAVVRADPRDTQRVFSDPDTERLIDFTKPVAVLFVSVMHCVPDDDDTPAALVRRVAARLAPGSFLVVSQLVSEREDIRDFVNTLMLDSTGGRWGSVRRTNDVREFFRGLDVLEPGLVDVSTWRPDSEVFPRQRSGSQEWIEYGGVGRIG
ncbi:SAM-dependent methyltransferase [Streptomyces sp. NPDC127033]|uniref:SAM-dependent methyltransferase n=1 Tax=Streptomyces sp. NPDC127033 TaxID=3347110 RepID=UPI00366776D8